jgi:Ca2+-binding RTX toxin-like protein
MSTSVDLAIKYGVLASAAYTDGARPLEWEIIETLNDPRTGFSATAYRNVLTGEVVIGYQGTDGIDDFIRGPNLDLILQRDMRTLDVARDFYRDITAAYGPNVVVTGHSLGGAYAQLVAALEGATGYAFNAPGVLAILQRQGGFETATAGQFAGRVTNINMQTDLASSYATQLGDRINIDAGNIDGLRIAVGVAAGFVNPLAGIVLVGNGLLRQHAIDTLLEAFANPQDTSQINGWTYDPTSQGWFREGAGAGWATPTEAAQLTALRIERIEFNSVRESSMLQLNQFKGLSKVMEQLRVDLLPDVEIRYSELMGGFVVLQDSQGEVAGRVQVFNDGSVLIVTAEKVYSVGTDASVVTREAALSETELQLSNPGVDLESLDDGFVHTLNLPAATSTIDVSTNTSPQPSSGEDFDGEGIAEGVEQGFLIKSATHSVSMAPSVVNEDGNVNAQQSGTVAEFRVGNGNTLGDLMFGDGFANLEAIDLAGAAAINNTVQESWTTVFTDPLLLDLNGDGVKLSDYASAPVLFDVDNDGGSKESTGWVSAEDGILVHDLNANGSIDSIRETLSEYYNGTAGTGGNAGTRPHADGFAALKTLDSNGDNTFTSADTAWSQLRVWVDSDHDAVTDAGELKTLDELNITSIGLAATRQSGMVRDGNEILASGSFVRNGETEEALAARFLANPNGHVFTTSGEGTVVSTEGGGTGGNGTPIPSATTYVSGATGGEAIDAAAKGVLNIYGNVGNDTLTGDANNNWLVGGAGSDVFDAGAGDDVLVIDGQDLQANIQGGAGTDIVQVVGTNGVALNLAQAGIEVAQGNDGDDLFIGGGYSSVFIRGGAGDDFVVGSAANDALSGEDGSDVIDGGAGNDLIRGHRGRDRLLGGSGGDIIDGGMGDDSVSGGSGNDVLMSSRGDDVIDGGADTDLVQFAGSFSQYRFTRTDDGVWVSDTVSGRDGTDFLKNVEKAGFRDVSVVEIPSSTSAGLVCGLGGHCLAQRELLEQVLLELKHRLRVRERLPGDEEHVLHPVAEGVDARGLQVDLVAREDARDAVEEARPVRRHQSQRVERAALVRPDVDRGRDREVAHAAREPAAARRAERGIGLELLRELGLDHGDAVLVMRVAALAHDDEGVERVAVARGVHLGLGDVEAGALEVAADAREERGAVARVDHHLQPLAEWREPRLHDGDF